MFSQNTDTLKIVTLKTLKLWQNIQTSVYGLLCHDFTCFVPPIFMGYDAILMSEKDYFGDNF
jgi:hypothetical protein